jgi:hypothetical protein
MWANANALWKKSEHFFRETGFQIMYASNITVRAVIGGDLFSWSVDPRKGFHRQVQQQECFMSTTAKGRRHEWRVRVWRQGVIRMIALLLAAIAAATCLPVEGAMAADSLMTASSIKLLEKRRVLTAAEHYLHERPVTITAFHHAGGPVDPHEYYSQSDYAWPNPKNPGGPYIIRDGMSNPSNFIADRKALIHFSIHTATLTAAYLITRQSRYARAAINNLRAWFVDKRTLMNPNLRYSQAWQGVGKGTNWGIIDTVHLVEVARSTQLLERYRLLAGTNKKVINRWFADYTRWLTTSRLGLEEMQAKNNHGTCWDMQVAEFASLTGNKKLLHFCRVRFKTVLLPNQMAANGSFPLELARTKPYGYALFNLDALCTVCWILSTPKDNLWQYSTPDGQNMLKALKFMYPFIKDKSKWPYRHDVEYWKYWPVRSPALLFGGLAYNVPRYLHVWKKLNPNPTVLEILRNLPIRQPVLWLTPEAEKRNMR